MQTLTDKEAMDWCKQWPLKFEFDSEGSLCPFTDGKAYRVDISKMQWRDLLPTATSVAFLGSRTGELFCGGLVWIRRMGITSPDWERVALRTLERFRMGYGENRSIEVARAHLFRNDESSDVATVLLLAMLAEWDTIFVPPSGDWVAFIDHDDHITVNAKSAEIAEDLRPSLETWGSTTSTVPRTFY